MARMPREDGKRIAFGLGHLAKKSLREVLGPELPGRLRLLEVPGGV